MEWMNLILQAVSTVGFPICAFFVSFLSLRYCYDKSAEQHEKAFLEISKLADAINNNTLTLTKLCEKVDDLSNDGK